MSGYTEFAWVNPRERFRSEALAGSADDSAHFDHCGELSLGDEPYDHGAFVYASAAGAPTYFVISMRKAEEFQDGAVTKIEHGIFQAIKMVHREMEAFTVPLSHGMEEKARRG